MAPGNKPEGYHRSIRPAAPAQTVDQAENQAHLMVLVDGFFDLVEDQRQFLLLRPAYGSDAAVLEKMGKGKDWWTRQKKANPLLGAMQTSGIFQGSRMARLWGEAQIGLTLKYLTDVRDDGELPHKIRMEAIKLLGRLGGQLQDIGTKNTYNLLFQLGLVARDEEGRGAFDITKYNLWEGAIEGEISDGPTESETENATV